MTRLFKVLRKAVRDRAAERDEIEPLPTGVPSVRPMTDARTGSLVAQSATGVRIDGKTCLVTGSNSGLGKAVAIDLARRGGHVLMACRSGHPDAGEEVRAASGSDRVEMLRVDLSDTRSVHRLCDELHDRDTTIDIARDAPWFLKPLVVPMMKLFFLTPEKAARPVSYLCCADDAGRRSGIYLHILREKRPSEHATDPSNGARLWDASEALLQTQAPQKPGAPAPSPASGAKRRL